MKKGLLAILLLTVCCNSFSQSRFARNGAHWCIGTAYPMQATYNEPIYAHDTIRLGIPCSYIPGVGCLYVQNDTVYRILPDSSIHFLYDYSAHPGNVWQVYMTNQELQLNVPNYVPVRIDSVKVDPIYGLREIYTRIVNSPFANMGFTYGTILEGIGNNHYFLPGPWGLVDDGIPFLQCYYDSVFGHMSYHSGELNFIDSCVCDILIGNGKLIEQLQFSLSPNPATNQLNITFDENIVGAQLNIYNTTGALVQSTKLETQNLKLETANFSSGVYIAELKTATGSQCVKWVKM